MMRTAAYAGTVHRPYPLRRFLSAVLLQLLGAAATVQQRLDAELAREWSIYPHGTTVSLSAYPGGRPLVLRKVGSRFRLARGHRASGRDRSAVGGADFEIVFKSIRVAWPVLTGRTSTDQVYLEHGFVVRGDLMRILPLTRGFARIQRVLLPFSRPREAAGGSNA